MDSTTMSSVAPKSSLFYNRNFVFLWLGQGISLLGDVIFDLTLVIWIAAIVAKDQPWAPLAVSGVLVAATLPVILIGPLAGVLVDRWDKRQTMLRMDFLRGLLILALMALTGAIQLPFTISLPVQLGATYLVVFLASTCAQFFNPARLSLMGDIVEEPQRAQASGLGQVTQSFASILGPPLAAPLLFGFGIQWALLLNALSFGVSFAAILAVQAPESARSLEARQIGSIRKEFQEGLRFALSHNVIRPLLVAMFITMLGAGTINALTVFFFTDNLHAPLTYLGLMDAFFGIGIIVGAVITGVFAERFGLERVLSWSIFAAGILFLVIARMTSLAPAMALIGVMGICQAAISVVVGPLVLKVTPRNLIGRVAAIMNPTSTLAMLISSVLGGYLASTVLVGLHTTILGTTFGPIDTIFTGAGVLIVLAGFYLMRNLRKEATAS
jgi:MFS family permease